MELIGMHFTKISGEKLDSVDKSKRNMNFEFTDLEKDEVFMLKNVDALKIKFKHSLAYESDEKNKNSKQAEISFEGGLTISLTKDELKSIMKSWKKKQISENLRLALSNIILQRCTPKTIQFQQDLNIPTHIPIPRLTPKKE